MLNIRGVPGNRTALPWKSDGDLQQTHQRAETGIFQPVDNTLWNDILPTKKTPETLPGHHCVI